MATIKDIAARAGVSAAAVSRILNQDESLSVTDATREKVLQAAEALHYKARKKTNNLPDVTIGIFQWYSEFQEMEDPYYQSIRIGIEKYCAKRRIPVIRVYQSDADYMETLKNVTALICIGKFNEGQIEKFKELSSNIIFADMKTRRIHCNTISLDFNQAVIDVCDYLTSLGHHHIAYLGGTEALSETSIYFDERKDTFLRYCGDHGLNCSDSVLEYGFSSEAGYRMAQTLLALPEIPTAFFAASDPIALGAMRAIYEKGLRIPQDISIVGFDDISMAAFSQPPLTTVHAPAEFIGEYAAHFMNSLCLGGDITYQTPVRLVLPCRLEIRKSVGPAGQFISPGSYNA